MAFTDSCAASNHDDRGQGVKSCGNNTYCCGASGDCCSTSANVFTLEAAEAGTTISASSAYTTNTPNDTANDTSTGILSSGKDHHALAIGLGVGIGVGGFLLLALAVLYLLKRRVKAKRTAGYEKKDEVPESREVPELDASWKAQLPDALPELTPAKVGHTAPGSGAVHEIADGKTGPPVAPQELEASTTYDWEPRNEPQPRDGGFRPEEHTRHSP